MIHLHLSHVLFLLANDILYPLQNMSQSSSLSQDLLLSSQLFFWSNQCGSWSSLWANKESGQEFRVGAATFDVKSGKKGSHLGNRFTSHSLWECCCSTQDENTKEGTQHTLLTACSKSAVVFAWIVQDKFNTANTWYSLLTWGSKDDLSL